MLALCETVHCRRSQILEYFGETSGACGNCDTCLAPPESWDGTVAAQKLLSTVVRLEQRGQRYGAGHLVDILRGNATPRITSLGHESLSTFGVGADVSDGEWRGVVRQLLAMELLGVDSDGYGTLRLAPDSAAVLRGERTVRLRREAEKVVRSRGSRGKAAATADLSDEGAAVFEALRAWRAGVAKEQGVPAYVVFHDATLREVVQQRPGSLEALGAISGIGAAKLERHGPGLLAVLAEVAAPA
jgi:ATP-dependent DNA helicase RecQ